MPVVDVGAGARQPGRGRAGRAAVPGRRHRRHPGRRRSPRTGTASALAELLAGAGVERGPAGPHAGSTRRKTRVRCAGQSLLRLDDGGPGTPGRRLPRRRRTRARGGGRGARRRLRRGRDRPPRVCASVLSRAVRAAPGRLGPAPARRRPDPRLRPGHPEPGRGARRRGRRHAAGRRSDVARRRARPPLGRPGGAPSPPAATGAWLSDVGRRAAASSPRRAVAAGDPCGAGDRFARHGRAALARGGVPHRGRRRGGGRRLGLGGRRRCGGVSGPAPRGRTAPDRSRRRALGDVSRRRPATAAPGRRHARRHRRLLRRPARRARRVAWRRPRRLGDCLVVLLNSDASVRRLKGPDRPVQRPEDRARVLLGLGCVDAVVVFDEDDPARRARPAAPGRLGQGRRLRRQRPARGRSSSAAGAAGSCSLPYLAGRSTTAILATADVMRVQPAWARNESWAPSSSPAGPAGSVPRSSQARQQGRRHTGGRSTWSRRAAAGVASRARSTCPTPAAARGRGRAGWSRWSGRRRRVVTAAGTDACGALADVPVETWERVVAVNLLGTAAVVRAALPHLRAPPRHGRHRRLHPRPRGRRRRHGLLRVEVRRRRASPGRSRRSWPARSASRCSSPAA